MFGLAKCLELHGQPHEALILLSKGGSDPTSQSCHSRADATCVARAVIAARKERGETIDDRGEPIPILRGRPRGSGRRPDGRGGFHKLTREERQSRAARRAEDERVRDHQFAAYLHSLDDLYEGVADGDQDATDEWLRIATHMVDIFRETKPLFPSDGNKKFTGVLRRGWRRKGAKVDIESEAKEMTDRLERTMSACSALELGCVIQRLADRVIATHRRRGRRRRREGRGRRRNYVPWHHLRAVARTHSQGETGGCSWPYRADALAACYSTPSY